MVELIFVVISTATGAAAGFLPERLHVDAQAVVVEIEPISDSRQLIRLPKLRLALALEPVCGTNSRVESISVSVADTRQTYGTDDIGTEAIVNAVLSIPGEQLGPIRIGDFCHSIVASTVEAGELIIRGALTAHLSLRCARDEKHSMTYVSQALDIVLRCIRPGDAAPNTSPENQESSAEPEPRLRLKNSRVRRQASSATSAL
ncbi:MAG: hypothetical protein GWP02_07355 [Desulfobulbaceae bacterium]|nr:hypothetical protein [Desulfobulbaceae bacterium]